MKFLNSKKGVSLPELMVGISLVGIVALGAAELLTTSGTQIKSQVQEQEIIMNLTRMGRALRRNLYTAILLRDAQPGAAPATGTSTIDTIGHYQAIIGDPATAFNGGLIMTNFDSTLNFNPATPNVTETLAIFLRESQSSFGVQRFNRLEAVGLFWQQPTINNSGALYIGKVNGVTGVDLAVAPTQNGIFFDGLTEIQIMNKVVNNRNPNFNQVLKVTLRVVARKWYGKNIGTRTWCPNAAILAATAGCANTVNFKDQSRVIDVFFKNNEIGVSPFEQAAAGVRVWDRLYGPIYFFDLTPAQAW